MSKKHKILIAVGGTGGHLFPAQSLARDLLSKDRDIELLFAGAGLSSNHYFHRDAFPFRDVTSATPFRGNILAAGKQILSGVQSGIKLIKEFQPDLVIGFGSFHSFPLLAAAVYKRVPYMLFEPNAIPGKVNRLFSRWAETTAVQFSHARVGLKGEMVEVAMPLIRTSVDRKSAHAYFGLNPDLPTLLVFGGSQGAAAINRVLCEAAALFTPPLQIIHITGRKGDIEQVRRGYALLDLPVCVKEFEEKMSYAYSAADLAVCRAGALTLSELISYELPAILIPYPFATDDHQRRNAEVMEREIHGARLLLESELNPVRLATLLQELFVKGEREKMRDALHQFKKQKEQGTLSDLVWRSLK